MTTPSAEPASALPSRRTLIAGAAAGAAALASAVAPAEAPATPTLAAPAAPPRTDRDACQTVAPAHH
ncbi:hypothetical protein ABT146_31655, partial [Streptomyces sp. NPDC001743]